MSSRSKSARGTSTVLMTYNAYRDVGDNASVALGVTIRYALRHKEKEKEINL